MMSEEDSKLEQLGAAAKNAGQAVVETLKDDEKRGAIVQTVVDGAESAVDKLTNTLNNAALGIKSLTKDDLTAENIAKIAQEKGPDAVVEAIKAAGYFSLFKGPTQIAAMLAGDNGASKLADVINGKVKPDGKPADRPTESLDLMAMIMSGDFSGLKSHAESWFDDITEKLSGGFGQMISKFTGFDLSGITGMLAGLKNTVMGFFGSMGGGEDAPEETMVADTSVYTTPQVEKTSGAGLDGVPSLTDEHKVVSNTPAAKPATPALEGPSGPTNG